MIGNRKGYISVLNVFACFSVVMLHANGVFWEFSYDRYWITANIIESLFYFAVPVFIMISGVTLIDYRKRYGTLTYIRKRISKTFVPFLLWNCIGILYLLATQKLSAQALSPLRIFNAILNSEYIAVYWFFIVLFTVYLCIPFFGLISMEKRKKCYLYIIILTFVFNALLPFICNFVGIHYNYELVMPLGSNYLIYVLAGYFIDRYEIKKPFRNAIYVLGAVGLMLHCLGTWHVSYQAGQIVQTFKGYMNVPCILYSIAVFTFFKYHNFEKLKVDIFNRISDNTFGIYLVHWYILDGILSFTNISRYSIVYRVLGGIVVFFISGVLVKTVRRIPVMRKIFP